MSNRTQTHGSWRRWLIAPLPLLLLLLWGCGGSAPPTPVVVEKEVIKEVIKEVPVEVVVEKEVVREVVKEVVVVATPETVSKPKKVVPAAGTVTVAVLQTRAGSGIPQFCTAGCAETVYQIGIAETLFMSDWKDDSVRKEVVIKPRLALSWEFDSANVPPKYVDFKIRKGVKFHNGMDMTPADGAGSFNNGNGRTNPDSIHGQAGDFAPLIDRVEVLDADTVRVHYFSFDSRGILHRFSTFWQSAGIFSKQAFDQFVAEEGMDGGIEKMRDNYIATGPYKLVEWEKNTRIVVEAVPEHWRQPASVQTVRLLEVPETAARRAGLETGEWQIAGELAAKDVIALRDKGFKIQDRTGLVRLFALYFTGNYWEQQHVLTGEALDLTGLETALKNEIPWVGNPADADSMERAKKVRWALAMTIPQEEIFENIMQGIGEPLELGYISVNNPHWQDKWEVPFDPAKAKQYMEEAGYPDGFKIPLWVGPSGVVPEFGKAIAGSWLTNLNVKVLLENVQYSKYRPGLVQRTTSTPWISTADDGRSIFPFSFAKGAPTSSYTRGGFGAGLENSFSAETMLKMSLELDEKKRLPLAEAYFDYMHEQMLMPGVGGVPWIQVYDPKVICDWKPWPGANSNISGFASAESLVLC